MAEAYFLKVYSAKDVDDTLGTRLVSIAMLSVRWQGEIAVFRRYPTLARARSLT